MRHRPPIAFPRLPMARPALAARRRLGEVTAPAGRATALFSGEARMSAALASVT